MSDTTKEELVNTIKEWIKLDTEINQFQSEIKERKVKKKSITDSLVTMMTTNSIDCVNIKGGSILYKKSTVKKPINAKSLMNSLTSYFSSNVNKAEEVAKFIMENREESVKETIKRKIDK